MFHLQDNINKLKINNKYYCKINSSELSNLNIIIPNEQRIKDIEKVENIVTYQLNKIKTTGTNNFLGTININYCQEDNTYYLIDGQHRFSAIKKLFNVYIQNIETCLEIVEIKTRNELKENYELINKNTPLPEFPENIDKNIPEKAACFFQAKYPEIWSKTSRARRPHIYFNFFQETLGVLTDILKITDAQSLINIVNNYNEDLKCWTLENFNNYNSVKLTMYNKCKEIDFYLGLFQHTSNDEYGYYWVKDIINRKTGSKIKNKINKNKKIRIPKKVKDDSWNKYIGSTKGESICIVCRITKINSKNFHAGHIISDKNGGMPTINNILPICAPCNLSMGYKNMDEFIKNSYPDNYEKFINKDYDVNNLRKSITL